MTRFVLVSEYTRRIAHELDDSRSKWLNQRGNASLDYLPPGWRMLVPPNIDHARYVSDKTNLDKHFSDSLHDVRMLEACLSQFKSLAKSYDYRVNGKVVSKKEFFHCRNLVVAEAAYKKTLSSRLKQQIKRQNIMRDSIVNGLVEEIECKEIPLEIAIIRNLVLIIRKTAMSSGFLALDDESKLWIERANGYLHQSVEKYLSNVTDLYPDTILCQDETGGYRQHGDA